MIALVVAAIVIGVILPVHAGVNAQLRTTLGHPLAAALVSFAIGTIGLAVLALGLRLSLPVSASLSRSPWWYWVGGLLGAVYVALVVGGVILIQR